MKNLTNVTFRNNIYHVIFNKLFPNHADKLHHHSRQDHFVWSGNYRLSKRDPFQRLFFND